VKNLNLLNFTYRVQIKTLIKTIYLINLVLLIQIYYSVQQGYNNKLKSINTETALVIFTLLLKTIIFVHIISTICYLLITFYK